MSDPFKDMFSNLIGKVRVIKEVPATNDEILEMMALRGYADNADKARGLWETKKQLFWSKVQLRTGEVSRPLRWNDEKNKIEILDS